MDSKKAAKSKVNCSHKAGKRKTALARATVKEGTGIIRINSQNLDSYGNSIVKLRIHEPLMLLKNIIDVDKLDISVHTEGGGVSGQTDAIRTAISRALIDFVGGEKGELIRELLIKYDRSLIAGDSRRTEPHKPGGSTKGPRARRQKSYR
jgi:small subunit ribosomal protein S9